MAASFFSAAAVPSARNFSSFAESSSSLSANISTARTAAFLAPSMATVAIDGAKNAAVLAVEILALGDEELSAKLEKFRADGTAAALKKDAAINNR